jgi:glycosyltransferase involved in cell wall biosynthesis
MGYGVLRPEIQALAARARAAKRIHFLPPVPPADVTSWVAGSDVVAMPLEPLNLNLRLATPNKLWEAIAAGVPVVGPDFEQFRRIVHGGPHGRLGVLFDEHTPEAIASAMHELLAMPRDDRQAIRARCRRAAAGRWNWSAEARTLIGLYANLPAAQVGAVSAPAAASRARFATDEPTDA